jgi:hypothetical protein
MRSSKAGFSHIIILALAVSCRHLSEWTTSAQSISFSPAEGNALTPMVVTVNGFIGTNGPAPVTIYGGGLSGSCSSSRPCTFDANMGYFSGKHWVTASAIVNGQDVTISNYFVVREARAFINRACGTNGSKVIVTGYDFGRNQTIVTDGFQTQANASGRFAMNVIINSGASGSFQLVSQDGFHFVTNYFNIGATSACKEAAGQSTGGDGGVTITRPGGQPQPLNPGDPVHVGDEVRTGAGGKQRIMLGDGSTLELAPNSRLKIDAFSFNPANGASDQFACGLLQGACAFVGGFLDKHDNNATINTGLANIGMRGTEFITQRDPCSATQTVYLIHGQIAITPTNSVTTNVVDAPATIRYDATNVWISSLTAETYDALKSEIIPANAVVTFGAWLTQYFGCTNGNVFAAPGADPDGDGQNNFSEFLARTDPTTGSSVFKLISAAREGNSVRLHWQTHGGITNLVEASTALGGDFTPVSAPIPIAGDDDTTTNHLDAGVIATNDSRFYRIRLVQ